MVVNVLAFQQVWQQKYELSAENRRLQKHTNDNITNGMNETLRGVN